MGSGWEAHDFINGNSLLLEGLDLPRAQQALASRYSVSRFVVEQTQYLDWYYGIRRLLAEGARPSILVMTLPTGHLISDGTRGEYFAHYQMQAGDIVEVARAANLDMTTASNFWFANWSEWLGAAKLRSANGLWREPWATSMSWRLASRIVASRQNRIRWSRLFSFRAFRLRKLCAINSQ